MALCKCGAEVSGQKEIHDVEMDVNNPGHIEFRAPAIKCGKCGELVYHGDDSDAVFDAFDEACKKKELE